MTQSVTILAPMSSVPRFTVTCNSCYSKRVRIETLMPWSPLPGQQDWERPIVITCLECGNRVEIEKQVADFIENA